MGSEVASDVVFDIYTGIKACSIIGIGGEIGGNPQFIGESEGLLVVVRLSAFAKFVNGSISLNNFCHLDCSPPGIEQSVNGLGISRVGKKI
jgi:hypothetical protein